MHKSSQNKIQRSHLDGSEWSNPAKPYLNMSLKINATQGSTHWLVPSRGSVGGPRQDIMERVGAHALSHRSLCIGESHVRKKSNISTAGALVRLKVDDPGGGKRDGT